MTKEQYFRFYLMARAATLGWFEPLHSTFGSNKPPCDKQSFSLQPTFVASIHAPVWCEHEQWIAARWLYETLDRAGTADSDHTLRKIFFLIHTAGGDLSPLEVMAAVSGRYPNLLPNRSPRRVEIPFGASNGIKGKGLYEAWDPWPSDPDQRMRSAETVFFGKQSLTYEGHMGVLADLRQPPTVADIFVRDHSQYFVGDEIVLKGNFSMSFPRPAFDPWRANVAPQDDYSGLFILANSIVLDYALSQERFGPLNRSDFFPYPVIRVNGLGAVLVARNFAFGGNILGQMRRVWDKIGEPSFPSGDIKQCMLDERFLNFALKEIDKATVFAQSATATLESKDCFIKLLDVWPQLLQHELQTRPANVLHRLVRVRLPVEKSYRNPFATTDLLKAPSFFSQKLLESWNVAMAKRLVLQVKTAQLQEDRDQLGNLMRDAEALRGRLLVSPTSTYAESLGKILGELKDIRDSLKGARIVLRGSAFPEAVGLSSSTLLGAASSRETWLLPNEMRLLPLALEEGAHRFARVWIQQVGEGQKNVVRLQFLAELVLSCISKR